MDERTRVFFSTVSGAAVGGIVGYLYLTDSGRRVRAQLEPFFDSVIDEIHQARHTVDKARLAAAEGRRALDDVLQPSGDRPPWGSRDVDQPPQARHAR